MKIRIGNAAVAVALPVLFFGGIAVSALSGHWVTESSKIPRVYTDGESAGEYDPADIRGSYTFGDIEAAFGVPVSALADSFGVAPAEAVTGEAGAPVIAWDAPMSEFAAKNLEDLFAGVTGEETEIGTDSVRWLVALYLDRPYEPEVTTVLPTRAIGVLRDAGVADEVIEAVRDRSVQLSLPAEGAVAAAETTDEEEDRTIKGRTTFGEMISWGVSRDAIEAAIGRPAGANGESMRDFFAANGIEFSEYKDRLQQLGDAAR